MTLWEKTPKRLYVVPVRDVCNASCTFCYMKEKDLENDQRPQFIDMGDLEKAIESIKGSFTEVELTGGGDPVLHREIGTILGLFPNTWRKMYTNGFLLRDLPFFEEVNISRAHWDSRKNNQFYQSSSQNELKAALDHYRPKVEKVRTQTVLLKGGIDSTEKIEEFVRRHEDQVDVFMFRTLFPKTSLEKERFVSYPEKPDHPKVVFDQTLDDYTRPLYFIGTDAVVHDTFQF